jgi:hypothetical protein
MRRKRRPLCTSLASSAWAPSICSYARSACPRHTNAIKDTSLNRVPPRRQVRLPSPRPPPATPPRPRPAHPAPPRPPPLHRATSLRTRRPSPGPASPVVPDQLTRMGRRLARVLTETPGLAKPRTCLHRLHRLHYQPRTRPHPRQRPAHGRASAASPRPAAADSPTDQARWRCSSCCSGPGCWGEVQRQEGTDGGAAGGAACSRRRGATRAVAAKMVTCAGPPGCEMR